MRKLWAVVLGAVCGVGLSAVLEPNVSAGEWWNLSWLASGDQAGATTVGSAGPAECGSARVENSIASDPSGRAAALAPCDGAAGGAVCETPPEPFELFGQSPGQDRLGGWVQFGYHSHSNGLFNNHDSQFGLHQFWLYAERQADGSEGLDWGYRADVVYGLDGPDTQSFGNNPGVWDLAPSFQHGSYGWAIPQLYLTLAYQDWLVQLGHFYTLHGYEVVPAPQNFFYSHTYTLFNSEPYTHTGVLATYSGLENVEVYAGWSAGWDTGFDRLFGGDRSGGSNVMGGAKVALGDKATLIYFASLGDFGHRGEGYAQSLVLDVAVTDRLNYVLQSDLVETTPDFNSAGANHQYGLNQYVFYELSNVVSLGARIEWWKGNGNSQYEVTFGANVKPHANLTLRPELRHDWNPGRSQNFTTFAVDMIVTF